MLTKAIYRVIRIAKPFGNDPTTYHYAETTGGCPGVPVNHTCYTAAERVRAELDDGPINLFYGEASAWYIVAELVNTRYDNPCDYDSMPEDVRNQLDDILDDDIDLNPEDSEAWQHVCNRAYAASEFLVMRKPNGGFELLCVADS